MCIRDRSRGPDYAACVESCLHLFPVCCTLQSRGRAGGVHGQQEQARSTVVESLHSRLLILARSGLHAYHAAFMATRPPDRTVTIRQKTQLMSATEIERTLVRLAHEIIEKNNGVEGLGLVGIRRRGVPIAQRLGEIIKRIEKKPCPLY